MHGYEIDRLVEELVGCWPSQDIREERVKAAWKQSQALQRFTGALLPRLRNDLKGGEKFPNLSQVEKAANNIQNRIVRGEITEGPCMTCEGALWLPVPPVQKNGQTYSQVTKCVCQGNTWEAIERLGGVYDPYAEAI